MVVSKRTVKTNYRKNLLNTLNNELKPFIDSNEEVKFYACLFNLDLCSGEVSVSLNTEFDFFRKKRFYESNGIDVNPDDLKYSVSEWNYQDIVNVFPVDETLVNHYYGTDPNSLSKFVTQIILEYLKDHPLQQGCEIIIRCGEEPLSQSRMRMKYIASKL